MHCLICYADVSHVNPAPNGQFFNTTEQEIFHTLTPLDKHMHVIFVLRKVLQIPSEYLETFLKACPEIENWFQLCRDCSETIEKCKTAYNEVLEATQKFKVVQKQVVENVKSSSSCDVITKRINGGRCDSKNDNYVINSSRKFVLEHAYLDIFDPFVVGDLLAKMRFSSCNESLYSNEEESPTTSLPLTASISETEALQDDYWLSNDSDGNIELFEECVPEQKIMIVRIQHSDDEELDKGSPDEEESDEGSEWTPQGHNGLKSTGILPQGRKANNHEISEHEEFYDVHSESENDYNQNKSKAKKKFKCQTCGKGYSSSVALQQHSLLHVNSDRMPFECKICGVSYPRSDYLTCHMRRKHAIAKVGVNKCPERGCKVTCTTSKILEQHMMEHGGSPKLKCKTCGEKFYLLYALHRHQIYHKKGKTPPPKLPPRQKPRRTNKTKLKNYKGWISTQSKTPNQKRPAPHLLHRSPERVGHQDCVGNHER